MVYEKILLPRNDFVLIREEKSDPVAGLYMPESSSEGKRHVVAAVGPRITDGLSVGDVVKIGGAEGVHWHRVPNFPDYLVIKQENIILIIEDLPGRGRSESSAYEQASDDQIA